MDRVNTGQFYRSYWGWQSICQADTKMRGEGGSGGNQFGSRDIVASDHATQDSHPPLPEEHLGGAMWRDNVRVVGVPRNPTWLLELHVVRRHDMRKHILQLVRRVEPSRAA